MTFDDSSADPAGAVQAGAEQAGAEQAEAGPAPAGHAPADPAPVGHAPAGHAPNRGLEGALLSVTRGLRRGWAEAIAHTGLAPHQARALRTISGEGPLRPGTLADRLRVAPRSVTEVVDALVDAGLVERDPDPSDRRATILRLTDDGRALMHEITALRRAHTTEVFDEVLTSQEQETLAYLLGRLADRLSP